MRDFRLCVLLERSQCEKRAKITHLRRLPFMDDHICVFSLPYQRFHIYPFESGKDGGDFGASAGKSGQETGWECEDEQVTDGGEDIAGLASS